MGELLAEQPDHFFAGVGLLRQFLAGEQADDALFGAQHAFCRQCCHRGVFGACQRICIAKADVVKGVLSVQIYTKTAVGIQLAVLLVKVHIQLLIDDLQRTAHGHGGTVCFQHAGIAGVHAHAGANGRLRQVHRRNVAFLQFLQSRTQFPLQFRNQAAAGSLRGIRRALAAHQHNGGRKRIGAGRNGAVCHFGAHGPCASNGKACLDDSAEHGFPAGGSGLFFSFSFVRVTLFIGIVDGHRHILAGILIDLLAGVQHTILKEVPCFFGTALKAVGRCHQFFRLGHQHGTEQFGVSFFEGLPHPDVEEIGQVCIADVVIIGRIGGHHNIPQAAVTLCIKLTNLTETLSRKFYNTLCYPVQHIIKATRRIAEWICFRIVPYHGNCLTTKRISQTFARRIPTTN